MTLDYDRMCDMTCIGEKMTFPPTSDNCNCGLGMREGGLEPPSLSAPDPKSYSGDSRPRNKVAAAPIAGESAPQRHVPPAIAAPSTTKSATCRVSASRVVTGSET